jgi:cytochrome P450
LAVTNSEGHTATTVERSLLQNIPLAPPAPQPVCFSPARGAWILSQYGDVLTALRSRCITQVRPGAARGGADVAIQHPDFTHMFANRATSAWQLRIKSQAAALLNGLKRETPVELVAQFIRPWCVDSALTIAGIESKNGNYLAELVNHLTKSDSKPDDRHSKECATQANKDLDSFFEHHGGCTFKSLFLGVAHSIPTFLASATTALLVHPDQMLKLRQDPRKIPNAVEELLRYAGPVHTVFRQAETNLQFVGERVSSGDHLIMRIASANRDPRKFVDPDRLDMAREMAGHLALSAGPHSCPGASIVRIMTMTAIEALFGSSLVVGPSGPVVWSCGNMLIWPSRVPVLLGREA